MNTIHERLVKLSQKMENKGFSDRVLDLEELKRLTRDKEDEEENERPLYRAKPSTVPGTWTDTEGDLIKTSRD